MFWTARGLTTQSSKYQWLSSISSSAVVNLLELVPQFMLLYYSQSLTLISAQIECWVPASNACLQRLESELELPWMYTKLNDHTLLIQHHDVGTLWANTCEDWKVGSKSGERGRKKCYAMARKLPSISVWSQLQFPAWPRPPVFSWPKSFCSDHKSPQAFVDTGIQVP